MQKPTYKNFKKLADSWLSDLTVIYEDIRDLLNNHRLFTLICSRDCNPETQSYYVWQFIDRNYAPIQALIIRKLIDEDKKNNPISLTGVLRKIEKHRSLLTRSHLFTYRDLPYDISNIEATKNEYYSMSRSGVVPKHITELDQSKKLHEIFDKLSNTTTRSPDDLISEEVLEKVIAKISNKNKLLEKFKTFVDQRIAHRDRNPTDINLRFNQILPTISRIYKYHQFLVSELLGCCSNNPVIIYTDITHSLTLPIIDNKKIADLEKQNKILDARYSKSRNRRIICSK